MDEPGGHYAKGNKSERQTEEDKYWMISLIILKNKQTKNKTHRKRDETWGYQRQKVREGKMEKMVQGYKPPMIR